MIFLFLAAILLSLFILYAVSRHDFVLLRQSISLRYVFDSAFISFFSFFLLSRIGYSIFTYNYELFNPLLFFYLTRYWGMLPFVGIIAFLLTILMLFRKKKNKLRILDIYSLCLIPIILLDIATQSNAGIAFVIKTVSFFVLSSFYIWFVKIHNKFTTKDGFIAFMTILTYALSTLALNFAINGYFSRQFLPLNVAIGAVIFVSSVFLILIQKNFFAQK